MPDPTQNQPVSCNNTPPDNHNSSSFPTANPPAPPTGGASPAAPEMQVGPTWAGPPVLPPGTYYTSVPVKPKPPFTATRSDGLMALLCFALGYFFIQWLLFTPPWEGFGVTIFVFAYAGAVLWYAKAHQLAIPRASWYWLGVLLATGVSYSLWPGGSLGFVRALLLFGCAVYWVGTLFGSLMQNGNSNYFALDMLNLLFAVPFRNMNKAGVSLAALPCKKDSSDDAIEDLKNMARKWGGILLGLVALLFLLAFLLPPLMAADGGNFGGLMRSFSDILSDIFSNLFSSTWVHPVFIIASVLVGLYLFGLFAGLAHRRYNTSFTYKGVQKNLDTLRILPYSTVITVLAGVCVLYVVFVCSQIPHYFSAFAGQLAPGYEVYSALARQGFFELCRIASFNLGMLAVLNSFCKVPRSQSALLRAGNILLMVLTLLLVATAFSKMALYIHAYGLTPSRALTCVAMVFIAFMCLAVIVLQFKQFCIMRVALVVGSVLVCALCLINLDRVVLQYNANRYINGTLSSFDTDLLWDAGSAGADSALDVYNHTTDEALKSKIVAVLATKQRHCDHTRWYKLSISDLIFLNKNLP